MAFKLRLAPPKKRLAVYGGVSAIFFGWLAWLNVMPGKSYDGVDTPRATRSKRSSPRTSRCSP